MPFRMEISDFLDIFCLCETIVFFWAPCPPPQECTCNGFLQFKSNFIFVLFCNGTQNRPTSKTVPINTKTLRKINHINYFSIHILIYIHIISHISIYTPQEKTALAFMPSGLSCTAATHQPVSASCCCSTGYIQCVSYLKKILYLSMCLSICLNISTVCIYVSAYLCIYVFMYVFAYSFACSYSPFYPFIYLCVFCRTLNTNTTKKHQGKTNM